MIEKKLKYQQSTFTHPTKPRPESLPKRSIHSVRWLSSIVSRHEAKLVFKRTFSRPFRLLFTNPVCAMFCLYYSYIYALIYLFLVAIPLLYGQAPFSRQGLFSYEWELHVLPASYIGLGKSDISRRRGQAGWTSDALGQGRWTRWQGMLMCSYWVLCRRRYFFAGARQDLRSAERAEWG